MKRDARLREGLVTALLAADEDEVAGIAYTIPRKLAGEILEEWDKMVTQEAAALQAITDFQQLCTMVTHASPDPEIEAWLRESGLVSGPGGSP
jgi:hypothetical protein